MHVVIENAGGVSVHTLREYAAARPPEGGGARRPPRIVDSSSDAAPGAVYAGLVGDAGGAEQAVLAALAGADVLVAAAADREIIDRLCQDLAHLGPLEHLVDGLPALPAEPAAGPLGRLDADQRELLALLLGGATLGAAAQELHLSRRTADRRLGQVRATLDVAATSEALAVAARAGLPPKFLPASRAPHAP